MNVESKPKQPLTVLMADDDPEDRLMTQRAFKRNRLANELRFVEDGRELMDYLHRQGRYTAANAPRPGLILLDLNMPHKDGWEALREIRADPVLRCIPIVVLTTSRDEEDVLQTYGLGVNSYIAKPVTFSGLVEAIGIIGHYWLEIVKLPQEKAEGAT